MSKISNVSFLGPILEKTAFELMLDERPQKKKTVYSEPIPLGGLFLPHDKIIFERVLDLDTSLFPEKGTGVRLNSNELFGSFKYLPPLPQGSGGSQIRGAGQGVHKTPVERNFVIKGPLAKREIIHMPKLPVVSKRVEAGQEVFMIGVRFKVSSKGKVEEAVLLASSGYPDVDIAAINYIKGIQFSPLGIEGRVVWDKAELTLRSK